MRTALIAIFATVGVIALGAATVGAKGKGRPDSATAYVVVTHTVGSTEFAAGNVTDKILGSGAVTYGIKVGTGSMPGTIQVTANPVSVFAKKGALVGTGSATATVASDGSVTFTNGKLKLTKGYGGEKGHSFTGTFTGTGKSATGPFVFQDKGIYR